MSKRTFGSRTFAPRTFNSATWTGEGTAPANVPVYTRIGTLFGATKQIGTLHGATKQIGTLTGAN